jgi:hypothetical protein
MGRPQSECAAVTSYAGLIVKAIGAVVCLFVVAGFAGAAARMPDRECAGLKGDVRAVRSEVAYGRMNASGMFVEERREPVEETAYDANGDIVSRKFFHNGELVAAESWTTRPDGTRLIRSNAPADGGTGFRTTRLRPQPPLDAPLERSAKGEYTFVRSYFYDGAGKPLQETLFSGQASDPGKAFAISRFVYGATGQLTEITRTAAQTSRLLDKVVYTYGRQKMIEQEMVYGPENLLLRRLAFSYEVDATGNWTRRTGTRLDDDTGHAIVTIRTITYGGAK